MAVIRVPKTPKKAFDRNRRASSLLLKQIEHLEWAVLPASQRTPEQLPRKKVKTEAQAAERVGQLTMMVFAAHADKEAAPITPAQASRTPVVLPPIPRLPRRESAARKHGSRPRSSAGRGRRTKG
jgi:hypothetical protein